MLKAHNISLPELNLTEGIDVYVPLISNDV